MTQVRVFVLPGGKLQIFVDEGTEDEARIATRTVLAKMQAAGILLSEVGEVEMHRTGGTHVHVVEEARHDQRQ
ncbi:MAG: hypothetical protein ACRDHZ_00385 [Ktedonobacteraceae bacterium]